MAFRLLIVDDDPGTLVFLQALLAVQGRTVDTAPDGTSALELAEKNDYDLALLDINLPDWDGLDLLERLNELQPRLSAVMVTGQSSAETAIKALRRGALDYLPKPLDNDEVRLTVERLLELKRLRAENTELRRQLRTKFTPDNLIGPGRAMTKVLDLARKVAPFDTGVLLTGESGTGKGLLARTIHHNSPRAEGPFISVNCAAIPETLLESELFGHKKGAFTGAHQDKPGFFAQAQGGTLLLDEIGELPLGLQVKLLEAVQEKRITPLGAAKPKQVDIRLLAATNRDLAAEVDNGRFRQDLYFRLNVIQIHLPPLRERTEDIPPLAKHFLAKISARLAKPLAGIGQEAMARLTSYSWPGNVRELENVIERAVVMAEGEWIEPGDLPEQVGLKEDRPALSPVGKGLADLGLKAAVAVFEKEFIQERLEANQGDKEKTAARLGINLATLYRKLKGGPA
jgi:DNA-binding NtrC family response regulator